MLLHRTRRVIHTLANSAHPRLGSLQPRLNNMLLHRINSLRHGRRRRLKRLTSGLRYRLECLLSMFGGFPHRAADSAARLTREVAQDRVAHSRVRCLEHGANSKIALGLGLLATAGEADNLVRNLVFSFFSVAQRFLVVLFVR